MILNWNGWRDTIACVRSALNLQYRNFAVAIIDNESSDGSVLHLDRFLRQELMPHFRYKGTKRKTECEVLVEDFSVGDVFVIEAGENGGYSKGNNIGISLALAAKFDYVWILNNDTVLDPNSLTPLVEKCESNPSVGVCGSVLVYEEDRVTIQAVGGVRFSLTLGEGDHIGHGNPLSQAHRFADQIGSGCTYITGAAMLVRGAVFADVGLLEERYFLYFEELDFSMRLKTWEKAVAAESIVFHKCGASIGTTNGPTRSRLAHYYLTRNRLIFYWLNKPHLIVFALLRTCRVLLRETIHVRDGLLGLTWKAMIDGILFRVGKSVRL